MTDLKRKTVDRLTMPFDADQATHVGKIIFGYDVKGLRVLTTAHTNMSDMFFTVMDKKERSKVSIEFNTYFLPELNQMVTMGYDPDTHVLAYIARIQHLNILDVHEY